MKVGIMSMQRVINYGSFLQAYALKKTIESLGHNAEFVDYETGVPLTKPETAPSRNRLFNGFKLIFSRKYRKYRNDQIKQNNAFAVYSNKFKNDWLPMLGITDKYNYRPILDTLVIGSDEVFNCVQPESNVGYSLQLFGKDNRAKRLITYAASFGYTTFDLLSKYKKCEEISGYLKKFDAVSVRDENSFNIIKELTGEVPSQNIDPVLIYDFKTEMPQSVDLKNYIVVYAYSGRINNVEAEAIQNFAHKIGKKTLSIGVMQAFTDDYINVDPFTMLSYIKNADYVITDTFHGTVFSIKYQIPFATIIRESNRQKLTDLLKKFSLLDRRAKTAEELEEILSTPIDKEAIKNKIAAYTLDSISYLKNSI